MNGFAKFAGMMVEAMAEAAVESVERKRLKPEVHVTKRAYSDVPEKRVVNFYINGDLVASASQLNKSCMVERWGGPQIKIFDHAQANCAKVKAVLATV